MQEEIVKLRTEAIQIQDRFQADIRSIRADVNSLRSNFVDTINLNKTLTSKQFKIQDDKISANADALKAGMAVIKAEGKRQLADYFSRFQMQIAYMVKTPF
jgi:hypothetical protein